MWKRRKNGCTAADEKIILISEAILHEGEKGTCDLISDEHLSCPSSAKLWLARSLGISQLRHLYMCLILYVHALSPSL